MTMTNEIKHRGGRDYWVGPSFGRFFEDFFPAEWKGNATRALRPAMDVEEDENHITVKTELAGVPKDEVQITIEDGVLTITGEKRSDRETKDKNYHLVERSFGAFHRSLTLPSGVDADKAEATFADGVLKIEIPKSEAAKPKKLEIK